MKRRGRWHWTTLQKKVCPDLVFLYNVIARANIYIYIYIYLYLHPIVYNSCIVSNFFFFKLLCYGAWNKGWQARDGSRKYLTPSGCRHMIYTPSPMLPSCMIIWRNWRLAIRSHDSSLHTSDHPQLVNLDGICLGQNTCVIQNLNKHYPYLNINILLMIWCKSSWFYYMMQKFNRLACIYNYTSYCYICKINDLHSNFIYVSCI